MRIPNLRGFFLVKVTIPDEILSKRDEYSRNFLLEIMFDEFFIGWSEPEAMGKKGSVFLHFV